MRAEERFKSQNKLGEYREPLQSDLADRLDKHHETINRSLRSFDANDTALALHWAQHVIERAHHFRVLYLKKEGGFPGRKLSPRGHEVQRRRLKEGYWDYNPGMLSWWYRPLQKDRKIEANAERAAAAERALKAIRDSHQTVRGAANLEKSHGLTEGRLFNLLRDPFCQGKIKENDADGQIRWVKGVHPPVVDPSLIDAAKQAKPGRIGAHKILSPAQVDEAMELYKKPGQTIEVLADKFHVSYATMQRTIAGKDRKKHTRWEESSPTISKLA